MAGNIRIPDINLIVISGRLTRDPEVRYTPAGKAVAKVGIANNRRFRNTSSGEWQDETTFVDVTVWGDAAARAKDKLKKGSPVLVEGRLAFESWEAKDGTKRTHLKITASRLQALESNPSGNENAFGGAAESQTASSDEPAADLEEVAL